MNKILDLDFVSNYEISDRIYKIIYADGAVINLAQAKELNDKFSQVVESDKIVIFLDLSKNKLDYEHDAQEFMAKEASMASKICANAILLDSLGPRILAKWYIKFHKPVHPTKIFSNQEDAINWLKPFL